MDRYLAIDAFVRVAEAQSFAQAARPLRVSRSVVTARIRQLEDFVGAPLFHRNTRSVRRSELGQAFLRGCTELVVRTNEVVDQMREVSASPTGRLRVHALPGFVLGHLAQVLQGFQARSEELALPQYQLGAFRLSVFYASTVRSALKLKLFLDALYKSFSGVPPWDAMLIERGLIAGRVID
jgi:DNA-binding transcriptional LysR family regulator